ncbi:MAG: 4Fe-4S dicluster domain-containing protein [bacterium]|nr:4Fe-4S dicluster domain-containing protein [bacterium]
MSVNLKESKKLSLEDKIYLTKINADKEPHLKIIDRQECLKCENRECTYACPVTTYTWEETKREIHVAFENCFECGTCKIACPHDNIDWKYPHGGSGVSFKYG